MNLASWVGAVLRARERSLRPTRVRLAQVHATPEGRWGLTWAPVHGSPPPDDTYVDQPIWGPRGRWRGFVELVESQPNRIVYAPNEGAEPPAPGEYAWLEPPDFYQFLLDWLERHADALHGKLDRRALDRVDAAADRSTWSPALAPVPWLRRAQAEAHTRSCAPRSLVWGPPGTGKTTTLGAIAASHLLAGRRVLLLSNNNVAVDTLLLATDDALTRAGASLPSDALIRTRSPVVPALSERSHLLTWSRVAAEHGARRAEVDRQVRERLRSGDDPADVGAARVRALRELDESWREASLKIVRDARCVACSVAQYFAREMVQDQPWDFIVLDEASVTPVAFAMPALLTDVPLVIGGDFRQLGPVFDADGASEDDMRWLRDSPFELLGVPERVEHADLPLLTMLDEQSRMADPICAIVSRAFYGGRLRCVGEPPPPVDVPGWLSGRVALVHRRATKKNASAELLVALRDGVERLLRAGLSVAVLTPFRAQASLLRAELAPLAERGRLVVGTVHRMQGQEADVAVFDTVNVHGWFLARSAEAPRLVNVAISRARRQVVIIADREKIDRNPWLADVQGEWVPLDA